MIREIEIENYKSIEKLTLNLGRVTVLIGENGCGKSNILESIALASAAAANKLDNEFLVSRGIRVTDPQLMRSAFNSANFTEEIKIYLEGISEDTKFECAIQNDNNPYSNWYINKETDIDENTRNKILNQIASKTSNLDEFLDELPMNFFLSLQQAKVQANKERKERIKMLGLDNFLIYSPENYILRAFEQEGQIQPLGINGAGLFKLLKVLSIDKEKINEIKQRLKIIGWFENFEIADDSQTLEKSLQIKDRYLDPNKDYFNQKSSNEGFLFLLFYFCLFISEDTPKFFAIDNIDASLNPKLCSKLIIELVDLAKKYDKQVIFTTHNPAILDGLNLDDDEQRLFVIYRNKLGHTKAKRIFKPEPLEGQEPVKLSEAFLRGYIGGLPKNF